jgi:exodeoxyribonuclease VII large subunit
VRADSLLRAAVVSRRHAAERRAATLAARLDALSPLAVLGRGYAVCWNDARTSIIRSSGQVHPGERVRVTLAQGELGCRVEDTGKPR